MIKNLDPRYVENIIVVKFWIAGIICALIGIYIKNSIMIDEIKNALILGKGVSGYVATFKKL